MRNTNVQIDQLINWRQLSKVLSKTGSETAIRRKDCPDKYLEAIKALESSLERWVSEYIHNIPQDKRYSAEEIKNKLNEIQW